MRDQLTTLKNNAIAILTSDLYLKSAYGDMKRKVFGNLASWGNMRNLGNMPYFEVTIRNMTGGEQVIGEDKRQAELQVRITDKPEGSLSDPLALVLDAFTRHPNIDTPTSGVGTMNNWQYTSAITEETSKYKRTVLTIKITLYHERAV